MRAKASIAYQDQAADVEAEADADTDARVATYSDSNTLWLTQEAGRLLSMQKQPGDGLLLTRGSWKWDRRDRHHYRLRGSMQFLNVTSGRELFIPQVSAKLVLLAKGAVSSSQHRTLISPQHPGGKPEAREDGYWRSYILRAGHGTTLEVCVDVWAGEDGPDLTGLQAARLEVEYESYGPHGRTQHAQHCVLPLRFPRPEAAADLKWRKAGEDTMVLPIPTHLLCHLDDPLQVLRTYVAPHVEEGDVVALGETPLAIMQGRFRHPRSVRPGLTARLACRAFHPTSSLATACGMQTLIDIVGRLRVIASVLVAVFARLAGQRGVFYRAAGPQARLIDDVTGTLPPYDQFITLGPMRVQETVDGLRAKAGCEVAVVDVNDLKRVQILAASRGVDEAMLTAALRNNPAGNADEQTPIVLVRRVR